MNECNSIATFALESQPDCIKSFPFLDSSGTPLSYPPVFPDIYSFSEPYLTGSFIVSCYRYDELTRERDGCLMFFNPSTFLESKIISENTFDTLPKLHYFGRDIGGILSCSWTRFENAYGISCISSNLTIGQYIVDHSDESGPSDPKFTCVKRLRLSDAGDSSVGLSLSLSDEYASSMCVTCSDGTAYFVSETGDVTKWEAHRVETWTSSFLPGASNVILTGSDDSTARVFDLRTGYGPVFTISCHSSGVTAVQFLPNNSNLFYTGGFDKLLVKHDYRNLSKPLQVLETSTAVWFLDFIADFDGSLNKLHISGCYDGSAIYDSGE
ncbi:methylated diphthine methylhydrolase [Theileria orientalis]|uniref:methylated diphthine methylhydrolase n=1 Tax=Theileria orientalis TaxID=68886 RepID=A0A976SLA8_THEOR|nr:methylated diphthine methylhydrolase [Theileria orientalis]